MAQQVLTGEGDAGVSEVAAIPGEVKVIRGRSAGPVKQREVTLLNLAFAEV